MTMGTASTMTAHRRDARPDAARRLVDPRRPLGPHPHGHRHRPPHRRDGLGGPDARRDPRLREAFDNAITVDMAIGGSTNAIIHLIAMAGRAGVKLAARAVRRAAQPHGPVIANLRPSGEVPDGRFLLRRRPAGAAEPHQASCCTSTACTVNGKTLGENIDGAEVCNDEVILPLDEPALAEAARLACSRGNLAPDGCVIKPTAGEPRLLKHTGPAIVFDELCRPEGAHRRRGSRRHPRSVLVLRNRRPAGRPGHARVGHAADPQEAPEAGRARHGAHLRRPHERHQLRHLHPARRRPRASVGGPIALVQTAT